jgi:general secretion pathway protein D
MGTEEQLALIDSIIDQVDVRRPQVAIEVSLVEIQNSSLKSLVPDWNLFNFSHLAQVDIFKSGTPSNVFTLTNPFQKRNLQLAQPETPVQNLTVTHTNQTVRGKILANPTVVTMDGQSATINITDQVPTISQSNTIVNGVQTITTTITTQSSGVTVTLTPQIFNDGAVVLNLAPNVSQPIRTVEATNNGATTSTVLLATRSMTLNGVRVQDGSTLVIGGLLRESSQMDLRRVPGMDKLPIVSAMFRSLNQNNADRTELVLMVTPHILKEDATTYSANDPTGKFTNPNQGQGGIQPVSLPKFIGPLSTSDLQTPPSSQPSSTTKEDPAISPAVNKTSSVKETQNKASAATQSAPSVADVAKSLLAPKAEIMSTHAPATAKTIQTHSQDALKMPASLDADPGKATASKKARHNRHAKNAPPPVMDEILKN